MPREQTRLLCLLSFNRPHYLRRTLKSLRRQTRRNWQLCLLQDGPRPDHAREDALAADRCVRIFRRYFAHGDVVRHERNIGIARNMLAAQHHVFCKRGHDVGYFFEDDLVLHRRYLEQLLLLEQILRPHQNKIPYFSAYGDIFTRDLPVQTRISTELSIMDHLWAFGLFRDHWQEEQQVMAPYFEYIRTVAYRQRDHETVRHLFRRQNVPISITSQDGARAVGLCLLGRAALRTRQPLAHYIGETGTHFTPEVYQQWGFGQTRVPFLARPQLPRIDGELLASCAAQYREGICRLYPLDQQPTLRTIRHHGHDYRHAMEANSFAT